MNDNWLGLDIGGANLKIADGRGYSGSQPFAMWKRWEELPVELERLIGAAQPADRLAVTMTGELADCFETKAEGVRHILDCVEQAAEGRPVGVYLVTGDFVTPHVAREHSPLAAASNWHALASFAGRYLEGGPGLLLDVGSTTTDVVPMAVDGPLSDSRSDVERIQRRELVYTGIRRSPVCAVVGELPWGGDQCPVARELFATTADAYVLLGDLAEDPHNFDTADGRPLNRSAARSRLARMLCMDRDDFSYNDAYRAAAAIRAAQLDQLHQALTEVISRMPHPPEAVVLSGEGEFLARSVLASVVHEARIVSLADRLGPEVSRAAPAHAVAVLASEREEA